MKICDFCRIQTFKVINCKLTEGKIQKMRTFSVPSLGGGLSALAVLNSSNSRYINVMRQQKLIRRTHVIL